MEESRFREIMLTYGQEEVLEKVSSMNDKDKARILRQCDFLDFTFLKALKEGEKERGFIEPIRTMKLAEIAVKKDEYERIGVEAIKAGKVIALANKETLVAAGSIIMSLSKQHNAPILPVDSEHSAIFQCLLCAQGNALSKIHLTASGGPFRSWDKDRIARAGAAEALKHPNWNMGAKVTIDSATMMNKGFEVMEARWLFDVNPSDIHVVVHPESIIHSMVEFEDGAVIAQMCHPDMREPIQFALSFPQRLFLNNRKLDFSQLGQLSFYEPDTDKFPNLALAFKALERGGNIPCALNAANEVAVAAYLQDRIRFYDIPAIIEKCIAGTEFVANPSLDDIFQTHEDTMARANKLI